MNPAVPRAIRAALLAGKRRPRIPGGSPTSRRGDGYEFVELREYVPGDDVRRIDWAASARSGELQTRIMLEDVAVTLATVVDDSQSMRVGRTRPLLAAALEAAGAWHAVALPEDRRVLVPHDDPFDLVRSLHVARHLLRPGSALLVISDFFDLGAEHEPLLAALGRRCDCTALFARDPWYEALPLRGIVRLRGAERGFTRAYVGDKERASYARAVREREATFKKRFELAGWRFGLLHDRDGARSLAEAFGVLHGVEAAPA